MCTVVVLIRPGHTWPLLLAANRDEMLARPWDPPAAHWASQPRVVAGRDRSAGGTWMGLNHHGLVAAVLNRQGSLGPAAGKRSRGELPLLALEQRSADEAAAALAMLDASAWRSFNLVLADRSGAIFVRGLGHGRPEAQALGDGLHMVTAHDPDDPESPRVARHLPRFRRVPPPDPSPGRIGGWRAWQDILADRTGPPGEQLNVAPRGGFGTVCSSLLGFPRAGSPVWLFAAGPPHEAPFQRVLLPPPPAWRLARGAAIPATAIPAQRAGRPTAH
jgi:hypothetical protein